MTDLRVMKGGHYTWKKIDIDKNVVISNRYDLSKPLKYGEVEAKIQDEEVYTKRNGDKNGEVNLTFNRLSLSETKYNVFMEICKQDGNADNFSQQDVVLLTKLNQTELDRIGIVKVIKDFAKGLIQVVLGNGKNDVLTFDFETPKEMYDRKGVYKVRKETNAWDLSNELDIKAFELLDLNPKYYDRETKFARYNPTSDGGRWGLENTIFEVGTTLEIPIKNYNQCWEDKYQ